MTAAGILKPVTGSAHKYELKDASLTVDIVAFGEIEKPVGTIAWPPAFETKMTLTGFRDAFACAWTAALAGRKGRITARLGVPENIGVA